MPKDLAFARSLFGKWRLFFFGDANFARYRDRILMRKSFVFPHFLKHSGFLLRKTLFADLQHKYRKYWGYARSWLGLVFGEFGFLPKHSWSLVI